MSGKWAHLGHNLGECWNDPKKSITFINIPKNASSFIKGCLISSGCFTHSDSLVTADRYLVILRDPIERWVSGIAQFVTEDYTIPLINQTLPLHRLIKTITVDDHTELQTYFLEGVDINKCEFLLVNQNLRTNINRWFLDHGYDINLDNLPNINEGHQESKNKFAAMVDNDNQIKLKLTEHYANDYELINRVKFYGN